MKTVTICGSMRFADKMQRIAFDLEINHGWNVLQCVYDPKDVPLTEEMIQKLTKAHFAKIDLSDAIYVVDTGGYIGEAVRGEIEYARKLGKEVLYHSTFCP